MHACMHACTCARARAHTHTHTHTHTHIDGALLNCSYNRLLIASHTLTTDLQCHPWLRSFPAEDIRKIYYQNFHMWLTCTLSFYTLRTQKDFSHRQHRKMMMQWILHSINMFSVFKSCNNQFSMCPKSQVSCQLIKVVSTCLFHTAWCKLMAHGFNRRHCKCSRYFNFSSQNILLLVDHRFYSPRRCTKYQKLVS